MFGPAAQIAREALLYPGARTRDPAPPTRFMGRKSCSVHIGILQAAAGGEAHSLRYKFHAFPCTFSTLPRSSTFAESLLLPIKGKNGLRQADEENIKLRGLFKVFAAPKEALKHQAARNGHLEDADNFQALRE